MTGKPRPPLVVTTQRRVFRWLMAAVVLGYTLGWVVAWWSLRG